MPPILVDTNAIIEAVRTSCWNALTGGLTLESVAECRREALSGSAETIRGYVEIRPSDLERRQAVHDVSPTL